MFEANAPADDIKIINSIANSLNITFLDTLNIIEQNNSISAKASYEKFKRPVG